MAITFPHPAASPPMSAVARILSRFDRSQLAAFVTVAIDLLDTLDGDPDLEPEETDTGGDEGEPDFSKPPKNYGPGCTISDPDFCTAGDDRIAAGPASLYGAREDSGPGEADDAEEQERMIPVFGVDQTQGAIASTRCRRPESFRDGGGR